MLDHRAFQEFTVRLQYAVTKSEVAVGSDAGIHCHRELGRYLSG